MNTSVDRATQSRRRAEAYGFLAELFGTPLDEKTLERIGAAAGSMSAEDAGMAAELHAVFSGAFDPGVLADRITSEHARLFLGLRKGYGPPPPYESLWREERIMGDSTLSVAAAYRDSGFENQGPLGPCDHIACELRFMACLCKAEEQALLTGRSAEAKWARQHQTSFLREHLTAWVPAYCRRLAGQAKEPLYQALARVTEAVLREEARE